ncbi:putative 2-amino-3-carboxymuconate-6-semialdehyde decarboxylase-like isoform X3 [Apostichopus japonicus]|uniref:2-amino-3-carboxymuconate-6-semialdehyde decarboxylase n=1 Tax=Stichopus japonicus TaxID=307972 RepID=A0A2G8LQE3_STIJA|nr:putative 2-amino-3-carboxymuconate-6-semialdehyde decarboxylase-like isoform X3 [Apostichopus japonicus]
MELGFPGVQIGSHINDWNLDAPELQPIFAAAEEYDCALFVHPWDMQLDGRMKKYWLPWLVGMPGETAQAMCCLIFGGILERYPKLKVMFAHGGGAFPFTIGRIEHGFNVRPDLCAVENDVNPRKYLGKIYTDSLVHDPGALEYLIKTIGENRVSLGSDYPFPLGEHHPGKLIESMDSLSEDVKDALLAGNALEFLGLDRSQFDVAGTSSSSSEDAKSIQNHEVSELPVKDKKSVFSPETVPVLLANSITMYIPHVNTYFGIANLSRDWLTDFSIFQTQNLSTISAKH